MYNATGCSVCINGVFILIIIFIFVHSKPKFTCKNLSCMYRTSYNCTIAIKYTSSINSIFTNWLKMHIFNNRYVEFKSF